MVNDDVQASVGLRNRAKQARSMATVRAILDGALRVLRTDGGAALTTRRISEECGVRVGSIYQYFRNVDEIIASLHVERRQRTIDAMRAVFTDENLARPLDEFWVIVKEALAHIAWGGQEDIELHRLVLNSPAVRETVADTSAELLDYIVRLMRHYGSTWPDADLRVMAEFVVKVNFAGYESRADIDGPLAQYIHQRTQELEFHLVQRAVRDPQP